MAIRRARARRVGARALERLLQRLPVDRADLDEDGLHRRGRLGRHVWLTARPLLFGRLDAEVEVARACEARLDRRRGRVEDGDVRAPPEPAEDLAQALVDVRRKGRVDTDQLELREAEFDLIDIRRRHGVAHILQQLEVVADELRRRLRARLL